MFMPSLTRSTRLTQWRARLSLSLSLSRKPLSHSPLPPHPLQALPPFVPFEPLAHSLLLSAQSLPPRLLADPTAAPAPHAPPLRIILSADGFLNEHLQHLHEQRQQEETGPKTAPVPSTPRRPQLVGQRFGSLLPDALPPPPTSVPLLDLVPPLPVLTLAPAEVTFCDGCSSYLPQALLLAPLALPLSTSAEVDASIVSLARDPAFFAPCPSPSVAARAASVANLYPWRSVFTADNMHLARSFVRRANAINTRAKAVCDVIAGCTSVKGPGRLTYRGLLTGEEVDPAVLIKRYSLFVALNKKLLGGIGANLGLRAGSSLSMTERLFVEGGVPRSIFVRRGSPNGEPNSQDVLFAIGMRGDMRARGRARRKRGEDAREVSARADVAFCAGRLRMRMPHTCA